MTMYDDTAQPFGYEENWTCSQCGIELRGVPVDKRSYIRGKEFKPASMAYVQSKCVGCGKIICGQCIDLLKPKGYVLPKDVQCPDCGLKIGDGPALVPEPLAERFDTQGIGVEATTYVKDLKSQSVWIIIWSIVNFFGGLLLLSDAGDMPELAIGMPLFLMYILLGMSVLAFISAVTVLVSAVPWHGFYSVYGIYMIVIGISNAMTPGFWRFLGIAQVFIGIGLILRGAKYSSYQDRY